MTDDTGTWHYGLVARWWAEVNQLEPEELAFYRAEVERSGEPALDLGCGAGRLLVPLLQAGLDVDGVDVSTDMLAMAEAAMEQAGIDGAARLAQGSFAHFALPRRYRTIICCDSFAIGGDRAADRDALRNVLQHLEPGGTFVMSIDPAMPDVVRRMSEAADSYPEAWPAPRGRAALSDGDELDLLVRTAAFDPVDRVERMEMRARLWRGGEVVAEDRGSLRWTMYEPGELVEMLETAGFTAIAVEGRYTNRPPAPDDVTIVVRALAAGHHDPIVSRRSRG